MSNAEMKLCSFCKQEKRLDDFHRNSVAKDGKQAYCRSCMRLYSKSRRGGNHVAQAGTALRLAIDDLRAQKLKTMEDLYRAVKRPRVHCMLKQINVTDLFPILKPPVPPHAIVPLGYEFD